MEVAWGREQSSAPGLIVHRREIDWPDSVRDRSPHLPRFDGGEWVEEHDDIQGEIVSNPNGTADLHREKQRRADRGTRAIGKSKSERHHNHVAHGVQDAITVVTKSYRRPTVAIDHNR